MMTNLNLTDMETCYKVIRTDLAQSLSLSSNRFGFEPEVTARLAQAGARIYEIGISYSGRTYDEGKKIDWKDGMVAFWHVIRFNLDGKGRRGAAAELAPFAKVVTDRNEQLAVHRLEEADVEAQS